MYKKLKELCSITTLFQDSSNSYWDDEYISSNLLKQHLIQNSDNASRNQSFQRDSIIFIDALLKKHKAHNLIDFGCGPGFYTEALAKLNYQVTGIDFSKRSIDFAIKNALHNNLNIHYRYENYLSIEDASCYDFASLIYCDYGSLSEENRLKLLKNIHRSLKPNGLFILDVFTVNHYLDFKEFQNYSFKEQSFWYESKHLELSNHQSFPNFITLQQNIIIAEKSEKIINRWYQHFTLEMLQNELKQANFEVEAIYQDIKGTPYNKDANTLCLLLRKK